MAPEKELWLTLRIDPTLRGALFQRAELEKRPASEIVRSALRGLLLPELGNADSGANTGQLEPARGTA